MERCRQVRKEGSPNVFLDESVGLLLEIPVNLHGLCVGLSDNIVDGAQSCVVGNERPEECIRRDDFVEHLDLLVLLEEFLPPLGVAEVLDERVHVLVVEVALDETEAPWTPSPALSATPGNAARHLPAVH